MPEANLFGEYLQNILEQPNALRATLAALSQYDALASFAQKIRAGEFRSMILTGMGASYHALVPLQLELIAHGIQAQRIETSELLYHAPRLLERSNLFLVVSQSGQSVEIVKLLEILRAEKIQCIGVTNTRTSPLADFSDATLYTEAGAEFSVSSKTYIAALAALAMLGTIFTQQNILERATQLLQAADAMENYLTRWQSHVAGLMTDLKEIQHMVLVGRGPSLAAAGTGALIIREASRLPCLDMSSAAFRHGPMEMISPQLFVLIFRGVAPTQELNARLADDIRAAGGRAAFVDDANASDVFSLPPVADIALPLMEFLAPEMISLALARLRGHIPGNFERNTKITTTE